jgi:hypothetical protein
MPGTSGFDVDPEEWRKQFWGDDASTKTDTAPKGNGADSDGWSEPDMGVLRLRRRPPPALPLEVFGETWKQWLLDAAVAAACPVDYVVAPLLASVSTLIGNARWAQAGQDGANRRTCGRWWSATPARASLPAPIV